MNESTFTPKTAHIREYAGPFAGYILMLIAGLIILSLLPPANLWEGIDHPLFVGVPLTVFGLLHILLGAPMHLYGAYHAPRTIKTFRSVQSTSGQPQRLLTDGYYARVRHPFYAMNMFSIFGLMFSFGSVYTLVLGLIALGVFYANGFLDERWLRANFGEAYRAYTLRVPARYFTPLTGLYTAVLLAISIASIFV